MALLSAMAGRTLILVAEHHCMLRYKPDRTNSHYKLSESTPLSLLRFQSST